nr:reverse transcriptase domain-containing protein [Tanacetum cinerariifolium]
MGHIKYGGQRNYRCITTHADLADQLLHHEVEARVDELVEEVEEPKNQRAELVDELVIKIIKEVTEVDVRNVSVNNNRDGCSYKEFLACNPKDYDGKGDAIAYTHWTEKMELVQDMSGCGDNQKVKYIVGSFICKALTWWNSQVQTRGREAAVDMTWLVPHLVTPENQMIKRNGSLKKNTEKKRNGEESSRYRNIKDDNKRSRTGRAFTTTTNPVRKEYTGLKGGAKDDKEEIFQIKLWLLMGVKVVETMATRYVAFILGAEEARQDPNIVTGTFTLNNHYATTLFDSGADYNIVSTNFILLLDIEPNNSGFSYEIEIARGKLVEINKVIRGCKLEIEGHTFDIDLIPFGHGRFNMPYLGVKLLGGAVSREVGFISGLAIRRATNAVDLISLLP